MKYPAWVYNVAPRRHGFLNEYLLARYSTATYELLVGQGAPNAPQRTQAIAISISSSP